MNRLRAVFNWNTPALFDKENPLCDFLNFFNVTLMSLLVIVDLLSSVVVVEQMQGYLEIDDTRTAWIAKAFFFSSALAPLFSIYAANKYGYKFMLFLGHIIFSIGSIGTGFSTNYYEVLFFRALGGMGGGIVLTVSLNIITITVPERLRTVAVTAFTNLFFGGGIATGLLLGGYFGQMGYWRAIFFINLYLSLPTLLLTWILIPETPKLKLKPYDFFGFFCIAVFFLTLLFVVTQAKAPWNTLGWRSPFIVGCYLVLLISFVAFLLHTHRNDQALVDIKLFMSANFFIGSLGLIVIGFMIFGVTIELMGILQNIYLYEYWMVGKFVCVVGFIYLVFGVVTTRPFPPDLTALFYFIRTAPDHLQLLCASKYHHPKRAEPNRVAARHPVGRDCPRDRPLDGPGAFPVCPNRRVPRRCAPHLFQADGRHLWQLPDRDDRGHQNALPRASFWGASEHLLGPFSQLFYGTKQTYYRRDWAGNYLGHKQTADLIIQGIVGQAEIASLNDAITILGIATLVIAILITGLMIYCAYWGYSSHSHLETEKRAEKIPKWRLDMNYRVGRQQKRNSLCI